METGPLTKEKKIQDWQLIALFSFGVVFLILLLYLVFTHSSISHEQCETVRIVLALAAAGIGAIVPGTIRADISNFAKAGGAAAFFIIVLCVYTCPGNSPNPAKSPSDNSLGKAPNDNEAPDGNVAPRSKRPPESHPPTTEPKPVPALDIANSPQATQPVPEPTLHDVDQQGNAYALVWSIDPECHKFNPVGPKGTKLQCGLNRAGIHIDNDNTPFDKWVFGVEAPGPVSEIHCNPTGSNEPVIAPYNSSTINGNFATCTGLINGGDGDVVVTVKWREKW